MLKINMCDTVSDIVRKDYRTADVFKKYGINYCCSGQVSLSESCDLKKLSQDVLLHELERATMNISISSGLQFEQWSASFLIDYIYNVHHAYIRNTLPPLEASMISFSSNHIKRMPELGEVLSLFQQLASLITSYNQYEEEVIFPYIKQVESMFLRKESYGSLFVRTLRKPLGSIHRDQQKIEDITGLLREKTGSYSFPEKACTSHQVIFNKLKEFDNDLVQHKYLENKVLFPKAIEMEKELLHF